MKDDDKKLHKLLMHSGLAGNELADLMTEKMVIKAAQLALEAYGEPVTLAKMLAPTAEVENATQSAIITMMTNCAAHMMAVACLGEIRGMLEEHLDTGLMGLSEAQSEAVKMMVEMANGMSVTMVVKVVAEINSERQSGNKPPIFGDDADAAAKAATDAAAAATADVLARAMKG